MSETLGAKADRLRRMAEAGLPVPPFVVLPDALRRAFLSRLESPGDPDEVRAADWPADLRQDVQVRLGRMRVPAVSRSSGSRAACESEWARESTSPEASVRWAVRSSMAGEDSETASFAGQLDSFLDLPDDLAVADSSLLAAIQACWASAANARLKAYRRQQGLAPPLDAEGEAMGVILQRMVKARCSGLLFTVDPRDGDASRLLVSVAPGLGEDLVQGRVAGTTFALPREGPIPGELVEDLDAAELDRLRAVGLEIEALFGSPQDIEFAFDRQGQVAILQARPVTAIGSGHVAPTSDARIIWDNSNITESYAGPTLPLTLSLIRRAYAGVYRQFLELMGVEDPDEEILQNLLGFHRGRVYYQLQNWYAALALLPAFEQNRAFMEQMMGLREPAEAGARKAQPSPLPLLLWLARMWLLHLRSGRMTADFQREVGAQLAEIGAMDLDSLPPEALRGVYLRLEQEVLGRWRAPILADFMAMIFFGLLRRLSARWMPSEPQIYNELVAGNSDIESLRPVERVAELATLVAADARLDRIFDEPASSVWETLQREASLADFRAELTGYLDRYGDRCMNELKLESPNLRDDPSRLVHMIASARRAQGEGRAHRSAAPVDLDARRAAALARLDRIGPWRGALYRWVLKHARRYLRDRENQRFVRSRVFGQLRRLFGAVGERLAAAGRIDRASEVFYLTVDEVWSELSGTGIDMDLRALVALRRSEYATHADATAADRFETLGPPYWEGAVVGGIRAGGDPTGGHPAGGDPAGGATSSGVVVGTGSPADRAPDPVAGPRPALRGTACSAGRLRGLVRLVTSVDEALGHSGEILVAERTDPGWVFLFPAAAGLLVERGSPLSHSAIVARELGLPAIVDIPGLTARLRTGDRVEMDGASGEIWLLNADSDRVP